MKHSDNNQERESSCRGLAHPLFAYCMTILSLFLDSCPAHILPWQVRVLL
jgi:hypothetical protein